MDYTLIRSKRKTLQIEIKPDMRIIVRAPKYTAKRDIDAFVDSKNEWIEKHLAKLREHPHEESHQYAVAELNALKRAAEADLSERTARFAGVIGVSYGKITVRCQKKRWGSCSSNGNLSFNCMLMLCPEQVRDYVVVHELCHRLEMNHSHAFWERVEQVIPDCKSVRKWLRENGNRIIG